MRLIATFPVDSDFSRPTRVRREDGEPSTVAAWDAARRANPGSVSSPHERRNGRGYVIGIEVSCEEVSAHV